MKDTRRAAADLTIELQLGFAQIGGDLVELRSRRGAAVLRARLSDGIRPDTVFAPFHWPGANALTNPALDPHSKMPAFKACAVAIALHPEEGTN